MKIMYLLVIFLTSTAAYAQNCVPINGRDWQGCMPIRNGTQPRQPQAPQPAPQIWVDRWGAIATYEPNGSLGTASNMPSQSSAEQAALADCQSKHGSICKIQLSYRNQCAAMVVSDKGYNVTPATTLNLAIAKGMDICTKSGDPNCHVYYSACSLPVQIH